MRLSTLLLLSATVVGAGAIAWGQQVQQRAELRLRVLAARMEPIGRLSYQNLHAWPWGRGRVRDLDLQLSEASARRLGLEAGAHLHADQVELLRYQERDPDTPENLQLRWSGLHWPLPDVDGSPGLSVLRALGSPELLIDGDLELQYRPEDRDLRLRLRGRSPQLAELAGEFSLRGGPELFLGRFSNLELSRAGLDYRDQGLLARARMTPGLSTLVDGLDPDQGLPAQLERRSARMGLRWDADDYRRLQGFLHEPLAIHLQLDPPGRLELRNLALYAPGDLLQVLGLSLSTPLVPASP